jgi:hypothetical protein
VRLKLSAHFLLSLAGMVTSSCERASQPGVFAGCALAGANLTIGRVGKRKMQPPGAAKRLRRLRMHAHSPLLRCHRRQPSVSAGCSRRHVTGGARRRFRQRAPASPGGVSSEGAWALGASGEPPTCGEGLVVAVPQSSALCYEEYCSSNSS